jgi:NAD(P)-dependent dehydrogenase (short-subunit alcohol dehydrogenase family)
MTDRGLIAAMTAPVTPPGTAVVTGANSGIGRATAIHLAEVGFRVIGTVRRLDSAAKLLSMAEEAGVTVELEQMDVADDASTKAGFERILASGPVDVLVANAGVGGNGVVEDTPIEAYREVMEVNCYGVIRCAQAVLPGHAGARPRRHRRGHVRRRPVRRARTAAVRGLEVGGEAVGEALAQEVAPFGIRTVIIEPGITKSAIFAKNVGGLGENGPYAPHYRRMFQFYATGIPIATPASGAAETIAAAITSEEYRLRHACSWAGPEIIERREIVSDEDWVELGKAADDAAYYDGFDALFGVRINP